MLQSQQRTQVIPNIPNEINYGNFKPKGFYTQFKQWPITPMSSNQYWTPDEIVRFLITIKNGVMDPYRSHIQLLVTAPKTSFPVGGVQIDSSAQSFISQSVISSNNVEIERIAQYDTLAAYLTDVGFSQYVCQSRDVQGLGYSNFNSHSPWSTQTNNLNGYSFYNMGSPPNYLNNGLIIQQSSNSALVPTKAPAYPGRGYTTLITDLQGGLSGAANMGSSSAVNSLSNILWQGCGGPIVPQTVQNTLGRFNNVRAQYMANINDTTYPDVNLSTNQSCPIILNQTYTVANMTQNNNNSGFNPNNPYQVSFMTQNNITNYDWISNQQVPNSSTTNICCLTGYPKPYAAQFCRGTNQSFISPTVPQCQMQNGLILGNKIPVSTQLFRIPLLSSICGVLIPQDQFILIPLQALYNLLLQITLSRFAMFTTGYSDVHQFDLRGMQYMQQRKWAISQLVWNLHLYTFNQSQINGKIQASLVKGIPISSSGYSLASQYQLPNGQVVRNSWPIGTQVESLCEIICLFISNQYQAYSFCRKQFRLSNNITSMQIKFNTQFFPSQPITGNAGNPQTVDTTGDNWPFYQQILLSSNFLFNTNIPSPKINAKNFAINGRCYNVKNTNTFYDPQMNNNPSYQFTQNSVNYDTALGMPFFHQNRYVGKAAYVYSWQPYGHSKNYMTGLNTQGIQNFHIIFNTNNTAPFPSDQTLLIFTRQNIIVLYQQNGVRVIGN